MTRILKAIALLLCAGLCLAGAASASALPAELVSAVANGESDERVAAVNALAASGDAGARAFLQALLDARVQTAPDGHVWVIDADGATATDPVTGASQAAPEELDEVVVNNRLRRVIESALSAFNLLSSDRDTRLAAARDLDAAGFDDGKLPLIGKAYAQESDPAIKKLLGQMKAALELKHGDAATRLAAARALGDSGKPESAPLLESVLAQNGADYVEADPAVRAAAAISLGKVRHRLALGDRLGQAFTGISLASILLLAALGLAITYGLMGVINMAHGELIMVGAYTTYVVQNLFRAHAPEWFNAYLLAAVPASFMVTALVGMVLERGIVRFLYGRPLETLLATWGISLILIQTMRTIFGAQNVQVENPSWMSGGLSLMGNLTLPWNRIIIIGFACGVLLLMWLLLNRTRLGLYVRGVTQNRAMASCVGVHTARVDMWAFGLGSGIAGLSGCALSQIGNVGPDLGQTYIVDSFMVVVLGGVGQLAGTVYAALGIGILNKFLEAWAGAVLAKIAILVIIIIVIQKRPRGLFAPKGRMADG